MLKQNKYESMLDFEMRFKRQLNEAAVQKASFNYILPQGFYVSVTNNIGRDLCNLVYDECNSLEREERSKTMLQTIRDRFLKNKKPAK